IESWTRMLLRFYVRRAIPARGSSRSLEPLEFHISMRPTSPAADPSIPARVLRSARPSGTRVAVGPVESGGATPVVAGRRAGGRGGGGGDGGRGGGGGVRWSTSLARWRLQAPDEPICLPGARRRGARHPRPLRGAPRVAGGGRGAGDVAAGVDDRPCGRSPG